MTTPSDTSPDHPAGQQPIAVGDLLRAGRNSGPDPYNEDGAPSGLFKSIVPALLCGLGIWGLFFVGVWWVTR